MGMRPPRMCSRCHATAEPGIAYCAAHRNTKQERERSYAKNPLKRLFGRKAWKQTRMLVLANDPICVFIEPNTGVRCPRLATDVHHKVQADVWIAQHEGNEMSFYDRDNLEGLCHGHHSTYTAHEVGFGGKSEG